MTFARCCSRKIVHYSHKGMQYVRLFAVILVQNTILKQFTYYRTQCYAAVIIYIGYITGFILSQRYDNSKTKTVGYITMLYQNVKEEF